MRTVGLVVSLLVLAGCSSSSPEAEPSGGRTEGPQATAPSEALADIAPVPSRMDAGTLLGPDGDLELLANKVEGDLARLTSLHVEASAGDDSVSYDVDQSRCSGEVTQSGVVYPFVTTEDDRILIGHPTEPDRWFDGASDGMTSPCPSGPSSVVTAALGNYWAFTDPDRVGVQRLDGMRVVHFRKQNDVVTIDSWIAADGDITRLLKVITVAEGGRDLLALSEHDSADPVAPVPPDDQVTHPGAV